MASNLTALAVNFAHTLEQPAQQPYERPYLRVIRNAPEMYGPFITTKEQLRQIQQNSQTLESIRQSKLCPHEAKRYAIESQLFWPAWISP